MISPNIFKTNFYKLKEERRHRFSPEIIPHWFKPAAVLILFWDEADTIKIVLTERSAKVKSHKGEVSFPGGRVEDDETLVQAALREAEEEIGIDRNLVDIIGRLDDGWSRAAYHLIPFVGWYSGIPEFTASVDEVGKILTPTIDDLSDEQNREEKIVERHGRTVQFTTINYQDSVIFGLTADLLLEALEQGQDIYTQPGLKREKSLIEALESEFFAYQKSRGSLSPQSDIVP
jgi:8-oxo-dGTP pyrophosphatase MutT (NUDIX family)